MTKVTKRPKRTAHNKGLAPGEKLQRSSLPSSSRLQSSKQQQDPNWGWILNPITSATQITDDELWKVYFAGWSVCENKYSVKEQKLSNKSEMPAKKKRKLEEPLSSKDEDDGTEIIVISDDDSPPSSSHTPRPPVCTRVLCKNNPNCLNYLGQEKWENDENARKAFFEARGIKESDDPKRLKRESLDFPIGLKNLGATCYANALLQVWFHNVAFRQAVFSCQAQEVTSKGKSPIRALQHTFAALQSSVERSHSPKLLIEVLGLSEEEQQDALEFSKLFINLLASHSEPELQHLTGTSDLLQSLSARRSMKDLVLSKFEGIQCYHTRCLHCRTVSTRESPFLELEITLKNGTTLEERIGATLDIERLEHDNRYACQHEQCGILRDAERWITYKKFPEILHFSLLRFSFDLATLARKKSKAGIRVPLELNMQKFLREGSQDDDSTIESTAPTNCEDTSADLLYDLRGILLHKGQSAHHGHYECLVWNVRDRMWYQYNDDVVTLLGKRPEGKVKSTYLKDADTSGLSRRKLQNKGGNRKSLPCEGAAGDAQKDKALRTEKGSASVTGVKNQDEDVINVDGNESDDVLSLLKKPKRRRAASLEIINVDDGNVRAVTNGPHNPNSLTEEDEAIYSKDVYMLVYAKRTSADTASQLDEPLPKPPMDVAAEIDVMNINFLADCDTFQSRCEKLEEELKRLQADKRYIYGSWEISDPREESVVLSKNTLAKWIERELVSDLQNDKRPSKLEPSENHHRISNNISKTSFSIDDDVKSAQLIEINAPHSELDKSSIPEDRAAVIDNASLVCVHGNLNPKVAHEMARLRVGSLPTQAVPRLLSSDTCRSCIEEIFNEKLVAVRHNKLVDEFEDVLDTNDLTSGAWVSKRWLKEWRVKISDKQPTQTRPSPASNEYAVDILCQHGTLQPDSSSRQHINDEARVIVNNAFPEWSPVSIDMEVCVSCFQEHRRKMKEMASVAAEEKELLENIFADAIPCPATSQPAELATEKESALVVIPNDFIVAWRLWARKPDKHPRPTEIDFQGLLCSHLKLAVDITQHSEQEQQYSLITLESLNLVSQMYPTSGEWCVFYPKGHDKEQCSGVVCEECLFEKHREFHNTRLTVIFLDRDAEVPSHHFLPPPSSKTDAGHNGRPKRLTRARRNLGQISLVVKQEERVLDMKRRIASNLSVPICSQRLFYGGEELVADEHNMQSIKLVRQGVMYLKEEEEGGHHHEASVERGFRGTMLHEFGVEPQQMGSSEMFPGGGFSSPVSEMGVNPTCTDCGKVTPRTKHDMCQACSHRGPSDRSPEDPSTLPGDPVKRAPNEDVEMQDENAASRACLHCTFLNSPLLENCEMCDSPLL